MQNIDLWTPLSLGCYNPAFVRTPFSEQLQPSAEEDTPLSSGYYSPLLNRTCLSPWEATTSSWAVGRTPVFP